LAPSLKELLTEFRVKFPIAEFTHGRATWRYRRGGRGPQALLWLTGALGVGEFAFPYAHHFAQAFRVYIPDYPSVRSLDACVDGLASLLDAEQIDAADVVGGSFGGMLAQHLVRRHPSRVRSLVLSHTSPPQPSYTRAALVHIVSSLVPERPYRELFRRRLRVAFTGADPFWLRYFDSTVDSLSKPEMVSRVLLAAEFLNLPYASADTASWPGRILILDANDDELMPAQARAGLRALYPQADAYAFSGTGHSAAILHPSEYANVIAHFLVPVRSNTII